MKGGEKDMKKFVYNERFSKSVTKPLELSARDSRAYKCERHVMSHDL